MPAQKIKKKKSKPRPRLYQKKKRRKYSTVTVLSLIAVLIMVGSVLASLRFLLEPPEEEPVPEPEQEPLVPELPVEVDTRPLTDAAIESLLINKTTFIRIIDFPTTQLVIDLQRLGRRGDILVEKINYPTGCSGTDNPTILQLCPQDQNLLPVVSIYRPEASPVVFTGTKSVPEIEEIINGTVFPSVLFYQEECDICPRIFDPLFLALLGAAELETLERGEFEAIGGDAYPAIAINVADFMFQDLTRNLNLFILENTENVSVRQVGDYVFLMPNPVAIFTEECEGVTHFYSPGSGESLGYSVCGNDTFVGQELGECEFTEGMRQILGRHPEIGSEEACVGELCEEESGLVSLYGVNSAPSLVYNCKYREVGLQPNQEERILNFVNQLS